MLKNVHSWVLGTLAVSSALFVGCEPQDGVNGTNSGVNSTTSNTTPATMTENSASGRSSTGNTPGATGTSNSSANAVATSASSATKSVQAHAKLVAIGNSGVAGEIHFTQTDGKVKVTGKVTGLTPGEHGFHVHEKGDLSDTEKGESAGGHFNPDMKDHGRPTDTTRHAGDFGNITADDKGVADINFEDTVVKLDGPSSIVGRSIVIHAQADRFTQPSGDAGGRVAFGKIETK